MNKTLSKLVPLISGISNFSSYINNSNIQTYTNNVVLCLFSLLAQITVRITLQIVTRVSASDQLSEDKTLQISKLELQNEELQSALNSMQTDLNYKKEEAAYSWYEGSAITDIPWEWKYSTPFSNLFNIEIVNGRDISQFDYFIYAAKYQPLFPVIMLISIFYIFNVVGHYLIAHQPKWGLIFWGLIICIMILFSNIFLNSPTVGGRIFFWITLIIGFISIAITVLGYLEIF